MPQILRTTLIADEAQGADGKPHYQLPVNPLSIVLLTVKALNDTTAVTAVGYSSIAALLAMITNVHIAYRGASIIDASLQNLAVLAGCLQHWPPEQTHRVETNDDIRAITVPICLGRRPYDPDECFPATRAGDLIMTLTTDVAVAGANGLILQAETVELLDAKPKSFIKSTQGDVVMNDTVQHDVELPISNDILGVLLENDHPPTGATFVSGIEELRLLIDNVESVYAHTNWLTLHGELLRKLGPWSMRPHTHGSTFTPVTTVEMTVQSREQQEGLGLLDRYGYLDFDPLEDGQYALKTAGAARVALRLTPTVADANPHRVVVVEHVMVGAAQAA